MAAKTYEITFRIEGIGAINGAPGISDDLRTGLLNKFKQAAEKAYSGTLSGDFRYITTDKEFNIYPIKGPSVIFKATDTMSAEKADKLNRELYSRVFPGGTYRPGSSPPYNASMQLSPPPAPKEAPKKAPKAAPTPAPKAAPPVVTPTGPKKTYKVAFLVPNVGTFQDHGNVLFRDSRDGELLTKFRAELRSIAPDGTTEEGVDEKGVEIPLKDRYKTLTTSTNLELNPAGYYKHPVTNLLEPEEGEKGNSGYDSDEEDTTAGFIELYPVKTGGKRRKTRRSTRRKRTTRRR
jgi:hypothetical protein